METQKNSLTPKELVYKHIFDPTHVVTEEDLKNMKVGIFEQETSYQSFNSSSQKEEKDRYLVQ